VGDRATTGAAKQADGLIGYRIAMAVPAGEQGKVDKSQLPFAPAERPQYA
jgi:hypothetical protein